MMNTEEVLELLEIDSPYEFEYFEHLAELMECGEEISSEAFHTVLKEVESDTLTEILDNYFEDILKGIPDEAFDFYTLMTTIRQCLVGLAASSANADNRRLFTEELFRFRSWYAFDSQVHCRKAADGHRAVLPVAESLALFRLEQLGEERYDYDFSDCMDYPMEEYILSFSCSIRDSDEEYEDEETEEYLYADSLIDKDFPVIDGEFTDD